MNKEVLVPSSMLFIPEKNQPYFLVDEILDNEYPNKRKSDNKPRVFFRRVKKIVHYFGCVDGDYKRTEIYYSNNNIPQRVNLFDEESYQLKYSNYCFKFFSFLKKEIENVIAKGPIEYDYFTPYVIQYGKYHFYSYFVCGKPYVEKPKRHINKTPINKKEISTPLFKQTKLYDLLGYDLSLEERRITRNNTYKILTTLISSDKVCFNTLDLPTTQVINNPVYYINNIDQLSLSTGNYHPNTFCLFLSISKYKQQVEEILNEYYNDGENRSKTFEKFYNLNINYAVALFYILLSNNLCKESDFNCYNIYYLGLFLINRWMFNKSYFTSDFDADTFYRKVTKKFDKIQVTGIYNYLNSIMGIVNIGISNQCRFPDDWTKEEKNEWKQDNGIERKKRKKETEKRTTSKVNDKIIKKVIKLHTQGYSLREIEKKLKKEITTTTISKIIKNSITQE